MDAKGWRSMMVVGAVGLLLVPLGAPVEAPSGSNNVFYVHIDDDLNYWINADKADPAHTATNAGYNPLAYGENEGPQFIWAVDEVPPLGRPLALDPDGEVAFSAWLGSGTHGGAVESVDFELFDGSTPVASATWEGPGGYVGPATGYVEFTATTTPDVESIQGALNWKITVTAAASSIFMRAEEGRWSSFSLPLIDAGPPPEDDDTGAEPTRYVDVDTTEFNATVAAEAPETRTHVFNWTTDWDAVNVTYGAEVEAGNATITVFDGGDDPIIDAVLEASINQDAQFPNVAPGNWTVHVQLRGFQGTVSLGIQEHMEPESASGSPTPTSDPGDGSTTSSTSGTGTPDDTDEGDGDESSGIPGPGLPALLLVVAVAGALVRRRL